MKRLSLFTLLFAPTFSIGTNAQSTDLLTLEQLIPGGNEYRNYVPRIPVNYLWSGNSLIETENDSVWIYRNPAKLREKSFLFSYEDIRAKINEDQGKVTSITFSSDGSSAVRFYTGNGVGVFDYYKKIMTIYMLLRYPDLFKVGVAGGPVTDWRYYEVMYGERYMDMPQENPEGYEESSLLNKVDRLISRLLIIHGDEDPTVVMQHSNQFIRACIKEGVHPDFFIYPGHGHNMTGADRVHLHEHITRYFDDFIYTD